MDPRAQHAADFLQGLAIVLGPAIGIALLALLVFLAFSFLKKRKAKDQHGHEGGGDHGHHGHGLLDASYGWLKTALAVFAICVIFFLVGKGCESRMDERIVREESGDRPPAHETNVPATPTPCGPSEQEPLVLTVQPGAESPRLETAAAAYEMKLDVPDGSAYKICTPGTCLSSGERSTSGWWYVRNDGPSAFAMKCWMAPKPASTDD